MSPGYIKLRDNILVSEQKNQGGISFVLKEPLTGRFFRLREPEYFVARQLDGHTSLENVRQKIEEKLGARLELDELRQFVEKIGRLGLLEIPGDPRAGELHSCGRIRGSLLYLRLKAFDPDRLFDRLVTKVRFFFTPSFIAVSAALTLLAVFIAFSNSAQLGQSLSVLYRVETLTFAWVMILLVTTAHEFAHGLTCKYFGGHVHEIGFMLIYFNPAMYCNVSDAWLFPEKFKRLWVTFAGAYLEVCVWALATILWRATDTHTVLNFGAFVVLAASGIKIFFNLNPLIKLDGYYLLSDYLGIPNLRQKAFRFLGSRIKHPWRAVEVAGAIPLQEKRIYLIYGLLSGAYSFLLLGFIATRFGGFLIGQYQGLGFILFTGLLMMIFRNPFKKLWQKVPGVGKVGERWPSPHGKAFASLAIVTALAGLYFGRMELKVSGEFKILPTHNADVRARIDGIIEKIFVDEGDSIKKGDPIARLSDRDYRAELGKVEARIVEKKARLKILKAGPRREEVDLARRQLETAETKKRSALDRYREAEQMRAKRLAKAAAAVEKADGRLKYARSYLTKYERLFKEDYIPRIELEKATEIMEVRERELEEARAEVSLLTADDLAEIKEALVVSAKEVLEAQGKLKVLLAGSRPEEMEATRAEIARLTAQKRYLEDTIALVNIVSPITGIVTTPKLKEKQGQYVAKGDLVAEVYDLTTVVAEISVPEKQIADVHVGQDVVLKARAYFDRSFGGHVTSIAPSVSGLQNRSAENAVRVTTKLANPALLLKPDMTGNAKIHAGERRILDIMTRRFIHYIRVEFWSWW